MLELEALTTAFCSAAQFVNVFFYIDDFFNYPSFPRTSTGSNIELYKIEFLCHVEESDSIIYLLFSCITDTT